MSSAPTATWIYLEPRPRSAYRQLFIKGRRITARFLFGLHMSTEESMTPEQIASEFDLPLPAVQEAIAYCRSSPPEIGEDIRREEALMSATGMSDPNYRLHPTPRLLGAAEIMRLRHS